jgi:phage terminase small subunit
MGRPKKPIEQIKAGGAFIPARHAERDRTEPRPTGVPVMPDGLTSLAREHWDFMVPQLVQMGVATAVDTPALEAMCRWWDRYVTAFQLEDYRGAKDASNQWLTFAARFGMTPADRVKIVANVTDGDDLGELLKAVG